MRAPIRGGVHSWYPSLLDSRQILLPLNVTLSVNMEDGEEVKGIEDPRVVDMYKVAGDIANRVLAKVSAAAVAGAKIRDLCVMGDNEINEELAKVYKNNKNLEKGIGFPTTVSVNNVCAFYSPISEEDTVVLNDGDVAKIDLGVHIDSYVAVVANTVCVGPVPTGKIADCYVATHVAADVVLHMMRPGVKASEITAAISKVAEAYGVAPLQGVLTHELHQEVIDGERVVYNSQEEMKTSRLAGRDFEIEANTVWSVDVMFSTGEGIPKVMDVEKAHVLKRNPDVNYQLRMKASRGLFTEIEKRAPFFPFSMRGLSTSQHRLGLTELTKHGLLMELTPMVEKDGAIVCQVRFNVLVLPASIQKLATFDANPSVLSEVKLADEEILKTLALSLKTKSKKKKASK